MQERKRRKVNVDSYCVFRWELFSALSRTVFYIT